MKLSIYRVLSFLLLPIAVIFSMAFLLFLRAAFANPLMFIYLFLAACIAIYTFTSFNFLVRGIDAKKILARSAKDWIIVNAIVCIIYCLAGIFKLFIFYFYPAKIEEIANQLKINGGDELKLSVPQIIQTITAALYFLLAYIVVLFTHVILSFQFIKQYNYLFQKQSAV